MLLQQSTLMPHLSPTVLFTKKYFLFPHFTFLKIHISSQNLDLFLKVFFLQNIWLFLFMPNLHTYVLLFLHASLHSGNPDRVSKWTPTWSRPAACPRPWMAASAWLWETAAKRRRRDPQPATVACKMEAQLEYVHIAYMLLHVWHWFVCSVGAY